MNKRGVIVLYCIVLCNKVLSINLKHMPYSMIGSQYSKARSIQSAKLLFYFFIDINKIERNLTSSLALTEEILKQVEMELTVSSDGEKHIFSHCFDGCCHHC